MNRDLKEYYNEIIIDNIYGLHLLPYTIFDKRDLKDVIHDLLNNFYFDSAPYTNYICGNYEKYIKNFLNDVTLLFLPTLSFSGIIISRK